ncbi:hypothetical protein GCM10010440_35680 [Kitasatospora cinereorecta]
MNAVCPRCAESDRAVSVPHALTDQGHPLGPAEHSLLLPPPPPPSARAAVARSKPAIALYAGAALLTVGWAQTMSRGLPADVSDPGYLVGYVVVPVIIAVTMALAGLVVQLATRQRRVRAAEDAAGAQHAVWQRRHLVWQAGWLCRRCRVAFFPKGAIGPDSPASPAVAVAQLPTWVTATAAEPAFGVPEPTAPR